MDADEPLFIQVVPQSIWVGSENSYNKDREKVPSGHGLPELLLNKQQHTVESIIQALDYSKFVIRLISQGSIYWWGGGGGGDSPSNTPASPQKFLPI